MTFEHLKKLVDMMFVPDGSGGVLQRYDKIDPKTLNPLVLAYIGDAYFHLFIRGRILSYEQNKVQVLNQFSAQIVSAAWQDKAYRAIEPMLTEEEKAAEELAQAKAERADAVSKIIVEVDGMKFDGDETSQQRMSRSIVALEDGETMPWVLYDNTIVEVTKEQLKQVLRLAGQKQTELWTVPYTKQPNNQ